jgi:hypothetical protein
MGMRYQHDCEQCVPLGEYNEFDLYFCPQGGMPTVVARYGNAGKDYNSGLELAAYDIHLAEAKRRALRNGLLQHGGCHE